MFSGIIQHLQKPQKIEKAKDYIRLTFVVPSNWDLEEGESINIDGVCSTIEKRSTETFSVYYMPETLKRTSLGILSPSHTYNLERSLTLNSLIGGHLVSGHVDTTATASSLVIDGESLVISFRLPKEFSKYLIYKGSVAVNGVSLTVVTVTDTSFSVSLIPYTLEHTNLGYLQKGDIVNIEVDLVAKYLEKLHN